MKTSLIIPIAIAGLLTACAENPVKKIEESKPKTSTNDVQIIPDQKPVMGSLTMSGALNYNYKIYGDPVAAPVQAFSDSRYMYLQLAKNQLPPIPITRDGSVIEYEVKRGFMVMPKVDSVVLRLGPRKAYIDKKNLDIVRYEPAQRGHHVPTSLNIEISSPEPIKKSKELKSNKLSFELDIISKLKTLDKIGLSEKQDGKWRVCAQPKAEAFKAAIKLQLKLSMNGWDAKVDPKCKLNEQKIILEKL